MKNVKFFEIKNSIINIPSIFSSKIETKYECGELENMAHIYECRFYNNEKSAIPFALIFNGHEK